MNPALQAVALAIFRKVTEEEAATWEAMSPEEQQDALEWARAALQAAREPLLGELRKVKPGKNDLAGPALDNGVRLASRAVAGFIDTALK